MSAGTLNQSSTAVAAPVITRRKNGLTAESSHRCRICKKAVRKNILNHLCFHLFKEKKISRFNCSFCKYETYCVSTITKHSHSKHKGRRGFKNDRLEELMPMLDEISVRAFGHSYSSYQPEKKITLLNLRPFGVETDEILENEDEEDDEKFYQKHEIQRNWSLNKIEYHMLIVARRLGFTETLINMIQYKIRKNAYFGSTLFDQKDINLKEFFKICTVPEEAQVGIKDILRKMKCPLITD